MNFNAGLTNCAEYAVAMTLAQSAFDVSSDETSKLTKHLFSVSVRTIWSLLNNKMLRHGFRIELQHLKPIGLCRHLMTSRCQRNNSSNINIFDRQAKWLQKERAARR